MYAIHCSVKRTLKSLKFIAFIVSCLPPECGTRSFFGSNFYFHTHKENSIFSKQEFEGSIGSSIDQAKNSFQIFCFLADILHLNSRIYPFPQHPPYLALKLFILLLTENCNAQRKCSLERDRDRQIYIHRERKIDRQKERKQASKQKKEKESKRKKERKKVRVSEH